MKAKRTNTKNNKKVRMKPPLTYYGGKQKLSSIIINLIPEHTLYNEPFFGGGAVFFAKAPSEVEVINDTNKELINFYKVVQTDFVSLEREVRISLHSRSLHADAKAINENPHLFPDHKRAWAIWVLASQSFSSILDGPWGYDKTKNMTPKKVTGKKQSFTEDFAIRLQSAQIECTDAIRVIRSRDFEKAFHYIDSPYPGTDCGHYDGYTWDDYESLLKTQEQLQGRFLASSFPSPLLQKYKEKNGWYQVEIRQSLAVNGKRTGKKEKVEVLTANYDIETPFKEFLSIRK